MTQITRGAVWFRIGPPRRLAGLEARGYAIRWGVQPPAEGPARRAFLEAEGRRLLGEARRGYGMLLLPVLIAANTGRLEVLYVTHDGGTTWKSTTPLHIAQGSIFSLTNSVYVFDANQSWTWPDQWNIIYSSGDGGQHWATYTSSIQNGRSRALLR